MFVDRDHAGDELALALEDFTSDNPIVLALPRGGVPVAARIAQHLGAPLDVVNVRKLGAPSNPEFAFGAVGEGGVVVVDQPTIDALGISDQVRDRLITEAETDITQRIDAFRGGRDLAGVSGRMVIVVDDGLATGATASAAVAVLRHLGAERIVLAVPTASSQAYERLTAMCDAVVCLEIPECFGSVGAHYESFPQVTESQVLHLLRSAGHEVR